MSGFSRGGGGGAIRVKETDGSPSIDAVTEVRLPADMLVDVGGGVVSLPLGTAALSDTGTSAGDVPVLGTGGKYPALDGSQITNISGGGSALTVQDADGSPIDTAVNTIKFPNGSVTVDSAGVVSIDKYPAPLGVNGANLASFAPYLRAGYTFGDASGNLVDSVGVPHNMAAAGSTATYLQTGINNDAIDFGTTSYFERPPQGFSPGTNEYTLNWWFRSTDVTTTGALLHWHSSTIGTYYYNGKIALYNGSWHYGPTTLSTATWYMMTWQRVKDGGSYYNRVYINGVQEINVLDTVADLESYSLYVGYSGGASNGGTYYNAPLTADELLFYTGPDGYGAISSAAIAELYNSGSGVFLDTVGTPTGLGFSHADLVGYNSYLHDYWKFEESGTPLIDSISNNSLAATGSPTFAATGKNNNCIDFHSSTPDYLSRIATFAHANLQEYTLSYWVYVDALGAIQHFHQFYTPAYTSRIEQVHIGAAGELYHYRKWWVGGADNQTITAPTTFTAGAWHHIVVVKTQVGAVYQWSLYLDGAFMGSDTANASQGDANQATSTFYVGKIGDASNLTLDGKIDELAYWKGVSLDSAAVTALFNAGAGRFLESI